MTKTIERRLIDELVVRYNLEPDLRDIYVEGEFDHDVVNECLEHNQYTDHVPYQIDLIEINDDLLKKYGLSSGNKQRVIALAQELSCKINNNRYKCLVDRDCDDYFNQIKQIKNLVYTKFTSIEMCFFEKEIIRKILITYARIKISEFDDLFQSFQKILENIFCIRLADKSLDTNLIWIDFTKFITQQSSKLIFNNSEFITRVLHKNAKYNLISQFQNEILYWKKKLAKDARSKIRGHDFIKLLAHTCKLFKGIKEITTEKAIERYLVTIANNKTCLLNDLM